MTLGNLGLDSSRTRKKKGRQSFKVRLYHSACVCVCVYMGVYLGDCTLSALEMFFFYLKWGGKRKKGVKEGGGERGRELV